MEDEESIKLYMKVCYVWGVLVVGVIAMIIGTNLK